MILAIDVETTGLINKDLPKHDIGQPRVIQAAWRMYGIDRRVHADCSTLVNPGPQFLDERAMAIHGISNDDIVNYGIPPRCMLYLLQSHLDQCKWLVAYNVKFDRAMLERESVAVHLDPRWLKRPRLVPIDIMQVAADTHSEPTGQWEKLTGAYERIFGEPFEAAHDAVADLGAAMDIFWHYVDKGIVQLW